MKTQLIKILLLTVFILLNTGCQSKQKIVSKQDKIIISNDINLIIEKHNKKLQSKEIIVSVMNYKVKNFYERLKICFTISHLAILFEGRLDDYLDM